MAATILNVHTIDRTGPRPAWTAANAERCAADNADGQPRVYLKNTTAAARTIGIDVPLTQGGFRVVEKYFTLAGHGLLLIGPFPAGDYGEQLWVSFSDVEGVSIMALRPPTA